MNLYSMTLNEYLEVASSKSSTPGGGSVSAVVAANAAAMVSMVANLTLGKKAYENAQQEVTQILEASSKNMSALKELTEKDMQAFQNFMEVWRIQAITDDEKSRKNELMEEAAQRASSVPLELCRVCLDILKQAVRLAPLGNKSAISDVGVGAYLAEAALNAAMLSVDINLPMIGDKNFREMLISEKAKLLAEAEKLKTAAIDEVQRRIQG